MKMPSVKKATRQNAINQNAACQNDASQNDAGQNDASQNDAKLLPFCIIMYVHVVPKPTSPEQIQHDHNYRLQ
jgi:hypothetical protein